MSPARAAEAPAGVPTTGAVGSDTAKTTEPFRHSDEQARPGYYATRPGLGGAIGAKLAVTTRTGIGRWRAPIRA
jgi:putative alpha-1,2-mannosidase